MSRTFVGMPPFPSAAREALGDTQLRHNLAHATGVIRDKRARLVEEQGDLWEPLRLAGAAVKQRALDDLATHLEQLSLEYLQWNPAWSIACWHPALILPY